MGRKGKKNNKSTGRSTRFNWIARWDERTVFWNFKDIATGTWQVNSRQDNSCRDQREGRDRAGHIWEGVWMFPLPAFGNISFFTPYNIVFGRNKVTHNTIHDKRVTF